MEQKKSLSDLAVRLRVLKPSEKKTYLTELDEHAKEHYMQMNSGHQINPFSLQSLVFSMYYSLTGTPYTQPEFASQATLKDVLVRKKFNALFAGVVAYTRATDIERKKFKRSVLKSANPVKKMVHLIKMRQNGIV